MLMLLHLYIEESERNEEVEWSWNDLCGRFESRIKKNTFGRPWIKDQATKPHHYIF